MTRSYKKTITVRWQWEGFHNWPSAPDDVAFLRHPHRHVFHAEAEIEVLHDDRELEFILVRRELAKVSDALPSLSSLSCEQMASAILDKVLERYGDGRWARASVSEDGENGAAVFHNPRRTP